MLGLALTSSIRVGQRRRDLRSVRQFPSINSDVNGKYPIAKKASHDPTTEFFTCTNNDIHSLWANFVNDLQIRRNGFEGVPAPRSENPLIDCIRNQSLSLLVQEFPDLESILSQKQCGPP